MIRNEWSRRYNTGETALDVVRKLLSELRKYDGEPVAIKLRSEFFGPSTSDDLSATEEPRGATKFLDKFPKGT